MGREQLPGSGQRWQTQRRFGAGSSNFWLCRNLSGSPLKYDSQSVLQDFCVSIPQLWHALGRNHVQTLRSEQQRASSKLGSLPHLRSSHLLPHIDPWAFQFSIHCFALMILPIYPLALTSSLPSHVWNLQEKVVYVK